MTKSEIKTAEKMLTDRSERTEIIGLDGGGFALSVQFKSDGWQKIFYTLDQVEAFIAERSR